MREYYDRRAREYDHVWLGTGLYAARNRPDWHEEVERLASLLRALLPARTLDVACGTGFLTRFLPGEVTGLDQSEAMLALARERLLSDSSRWTVYKRSFTQEGLAAELGGCEVLHAGHWFVVVRA